MTIDSHNPARHSYITHLKCTDCGREYSASAINAYCPVCHSPLFSIYDLENARKNLRRAQFAQRPRGIWRWHELLPVQSSENCISLGEGDTPLRSLSALGAELKLANLYLKDESTNPTGTLKARSISSALSKAGELGVKEVIIPTTGNTGSAAAVYAAKAGLKAHIYLPKEASPTTLQGILATGADVTLIDGLIGESAGMIREKASIEGWFDLSTFKEPYRIEGTKTLAYEIAEAFGWNLPDVIIYPTGSGLGLVGIWKALVELEMLGWLENAKRPRLVAVQARGCAPLVKAFESKASFCNFWTNGHTIATSLCVPKSFADYLTLKYIYESNGFAVAVSDEAILAAQRQLREVEGVSSSPEGAATLAGLIQLLRLKWVKPEEHIVLINTGSGLLPANTPAA